MCTSCNVAFPYMRLILVDRGVNIAVGWTGTWTADFVQADENVLVSVGQKRTWKCRGAQLTDRIAVDIARKTGDIWFFERR